MIAMTSDHLSFIVVEINKNYLLTPHTKVCVKLRKLCDVPAATRVFFPTTRESEEGESLGMRLS